MRAWLAVTAVVLVAGSPSLARATPRVDLTHRCRHVPRARVPITLHLVTERPGRIFDAAALAADELDVHQLALELHAVERVSRVSGRTRAARRRALARFAPADGTVHVFVVDRVDDYVYDRRGPARGYYWRYAGLRRGLRGRAFVLVSRTAPTTTLAHEIGHVLGLRHSSRPDDLMAPGRNDIMMRFDHRQGERMRRGLRRFRARQVRVGRPVEPDECGLDLRRVDRRQLR